MTGRDIIFNDVVTDKPAICQSACITCQNKNTCRTIARAVGALGSDEVFRAASSQQRKKFASISDHLRREGFSYPNVTNAAHCWMYHKFGVATFYENQLASLVEQIVEPGSTLVGTNFEKKATRLAPRA